MTTAQHKQGTEEWKQARTGFVTCSRFKDVYSTKKAMTQTAYSYLYELLAAHLSGKPEKEITSKSLDHGKQYESEARLAYSFDYGDFTEVGFVSHEAEPFIGGSPDGLIDGGIIEIKCPFTRREHARTLATGEMPAAHVPQVQGLLWITERERCDFISYGDSSWPDEAQLVVVKVERDEDYIAKLAVQVVAFRDELLQDVSRIGRELGI